MKSILISIALSVLVAVGLYLAAAFIEAKLNFQDWATVSRMLVAGLWIWATIVLFTDYNEYED